MGADSGVFCDIERLRTDVDYVRMLVDIDFNLHGDEKIIAVLTSNVVVEQADVAMLDYLLHCYTKLSKMLELHPKFAELLDHVNDLGYYEFIKLATSLGEQGVEVVVNKFAGTDPAWGFDEFTALLEEFYYGTPTACAMEFQNKFYKEFFALPTSAEFVEENNDFFEVWFTPRDMDEAHLFLQNAPSSYWSSFIRLYRNLLDPQRLAQMVEDKFTEFRSASVFYALLSVLTHRVLNKEEVVAVARAAHFMMAHEPTQVRFDSLLAAVVAGQVELDMVAGYVMLIEAEQNRVSAFVPPSSDPPRPKEQVMDQSMPMKIMRTALKVCGEPQIVRHENQLDGSTCEVSTPATFAIPVEAGAFLFTVVAPMLTVAEFEEVVELIPASWYGHIVKQIDSFDNFGPDASDEFDLETSNDNAEFRFHLRTLFEKIIASVDVDDEYFLQFCQSFAAKFGDVDTDTLPVCVLVQCYDSNADLIDLFVRFNKQAPGFARSVLDMAQTYRGSLVEFEQMLNQALSS